MTSVRFISFKNVCTCHSVESSSSTMDEWLFFNSFLKRFAGENNESSLVMSGVGEGATPLMYACQQAREKQVLEILSRKPSSARETDRTHKTALHYCAESLSTGCAEALVRAAPDLLEGRDEDGYTALHLAVIAGNKPFIQLLLSRGADVNALDNEKHSVVHWATVCGEQEALEMVLRSGANISTADIHGGFPLHYAAQMCGPGADIRGDSRPGLNVLRTLLAYGADVDERDKDGRQPILWAASADGQSRDPGARFASSGSAEAILALVKAGASVQAADKDGLTALHCAASRGHTDCLETLVALCGAPVDTIDVNGCTALFYAVTLGHADATQLLLSLGAEPNRQDRKGRTPAHCGAAKGQLETLRLLLARGANLWLRNVKGDLPLHEAVASGRRELVSWLLNQRSEAVNVANNDGKCPIHVAAINNNVEVVKILLDAGSLVNPVLRSNKGAMMTPLDAALHRGHRSCAKFLQLHGGVPRAKLTEKSAALRGTATREVGFLEQDQDICARLSSSPRYIPDPPVRVQMGPSDVGIQYVERIPVFEQHARFAGDSSDEDQRCRRRRRRKRSERRRGSSVGEEEDSNEEPSEDFSTHHRRKSGRRRSNEDAARSSKKRSQSPGEDNGGDSYGSSLEESPTAEKNVKAKKSFTKKSVESEDKNTKKLKKSSSNEEPIESKKKNNGLNRNKRNQNETEKEAKQNEKSGVAVSKEKDQKVQKSSSEEKQGYESALATQETVDQALPSSYQVPSPIDEKVVTEIITASADTSQLPRTDSPEIPPVLRNKPAMPDSSLEESEPVLPQTVEIEAEVHHGSHHSDEETPESVNEKTIILTDDAPYELEASPIVDVTAEEAIDSKREHTVHFEDPSLDSAPTIETIGEKENDMISNKEQETPLPVLEQKLSEEQDESPPTRPVTGRRRSLSIRQQDVGSARKSRSFIVEGEDEGEGFPTSHRPSLVFGESFEGEDVSTSLSERVRGKSDGAESTRSKSSARGGRSRRGSIFPSGDSEDRDDFAIQTADVDTVVKGFSLAASEHRTGSIGEDSVGSARNEDSSALPDSGIEPSPRRERRTPISSPRRIPRLCRKTKPTHTVGPVSVTRTVQNTIRKYHLERKIFYQLLELKRLQIRAGRSNEQVLVKRLVDEYQRAGLKQYQGLYSFRQFEHFLYEQLHTLQAGTQLLIPQMKPTDDIETLSAILKRTRVELLNDVPDNPSLCTHGTHRCHHAAHAYTGIPCAAYITKLNHHTMPKDRGGFLPRIDPPSCETRPVSRRADSRAQQRPVTLEVIHGQEKQVISLPTERLDRSKRYYVTFTIKGGQTPPEMESSAPGATPERTLSHQHAKSF